MLLFSTVLEINDIMTKEAFVRLVLEWNQGSPHKSNIIQGIEWNGEYNIRYGDENLWLDIEEYRNENIIAVRYEKKEQDGVVWDTDYVMNFNSMRMAIRLDRSYLEAALTVDSRFSTPHFITLLIERGYIKNDGRLSVLCKPIMIDNNNIDLITDIINGKIKYNLPVVYISKTFYDEDPVNVKLLSKRLKGVAHVLVQKANWLNAKLKDACDGKNEYYGAIGIYYPNRAIGRRRYLHRNTEGFDIVLLEKVVRAVIQYSNAQRVDMLYTWQGVNNALLRDRLNSQREERLAAEQRIRERAVEDARNEAGKILESFDEDMQQLQKQIEDLTHTNESLTYENQGLRAKLDRADNIPVLYFGDEDEFFQDEIKEMILRILDEALTNSEPQTRRADVLKDIIQSNGGYQKTAEEKEKMLKTELKGYKKVSSRMKQMFSDLGFAVTEEGKHYKLIYFGDGRYWTTIAKTPKDGHTGMNAATTIIKNML